jgi:hypothetical protein
MDTQPNNLNNQPLQPLTQKSWLARHFLSELFGLMLAAAAFAGIYYWQTSSNLPQINFFPVHHQQASTTNWKTYTNSQYGFEFKYPNAWTVSSTVNVIDKNPELTIQDPHIKNEDPLDQWNPTNIQISMSEVPNCISAKDYTHNLYKNYSSEEHLGSSVTDEGVLNNLDASVNGWQESEAGGELSGIRWIYTYLLPKECIKGQKQKLFSLRSRDTSPNLNQILSTFKFTGKLVTYDQKMQACNAIPNATTQTLKDTSRLFVNLPKDIYPDKDHNLVAKTILGKATAGWVSNGGFPGEAYQATIDCWSYYYQFDGVGTVELMAKSAIAGMPNYKATFKIIPTQ